MVEITQEENPIIKETLDICTLVAVFAPLRKTLLIFRLSSTVTNFFPFKAIFLNPKQSIKKRVRTTI